MNKLGALLRTARGKRSIEELASAVGVNKNTQGSYERGVRPPDVAYLVRFSAITGEPLDGLLVALLTDTQESEAAGDAGTAQVISALQGYKYKYGAATALLGENTSTSVNQTAAAAQLEVAQARAHYRDAIHADIRAALEAQMPMVKEATAVAMRIAAHFGLDYLSRIFGEVQTLAFFGADEKHLTALIEAIIENEPEIRAAAARRATADRPEPTPRDPAGQ